MVDGTVSLESINAQLHDAEQKLAENEEALLKDTDDKPPLMSRLRKLDAETDSLAILNELSGYQNCRDDIQRLEILGHALCKFHFGTNNQFYEKLYADEFLKWYAYLYAEAIHNLREQLQAYGYPDSCVSLLQKRDAALAVEKHCDTLEKLSLVYRRVVQHVESKFVDAVDPVIVELCRPFSERVKYHFIEQADRPTNSRTDRLPEWLISYVKEHIFATHGPWEFIQQSLPSRSIDFLNEIIRMIQYVLGERNFFRHPIVAGEASKPRWLSNAIWNLLEFDSFVKSLLDESQQNRVVSLVDVCVAGDEELLAWWLQREKESVFTILFEQDMVPLDTFISPRAELFCCVIRSIRIKCSVFSFSGPYWSAVAAPMCVRFTDAIQATNNELRRILTQRSISDDILYKNVVEWIELINGTKMAAEVLCDESISDDVNDDLEGYGRALDRLQGALLEDFVTNVVEVLLMERTKLASYLMRCSHLLASGSDDIDPMESMQDLSADLIDTQRLLRIVLRACDSARTTSEYDAHNIMRERILSLMAENLLEVAIDLHGMTPDLRQEGCAAFCRDVESLLDIDGIPNHAFRLLDIARFMKQDSMQLGGIGGALCGLAGRPAPLTEAVFEADDRLFDEATSMIRAKGFKYLDLADVFAVLNRRRDL